MSVCNVILLVCAVLFMCKKVVLCLVLHCFVLWDENTG